MMEKVDHESLAKMLLEFQKHKESTHVLAWKMQRRSDMIDCQAIIVESLEKSSRMIKAYTITKLWT